MKTVRKYANMAFLLVSVAAIVPVYGNPEVIVDNQEEIAIQEEVAVNPENRVVSAVKNAFKAIEPAIRPVIICLTVAFVAHNYINFVAQRAINRHQKNLEDEQKFVAGIVGALKQVQSIKDLCVYGCSDNDLNALENDFNLLTQVLKNHTKH